MAKTLKLPKIETRQTGQPDGLNNVPFYTPCGTHLKSGKKSCGFGGSESFARNAAHRMLRSGAYVEVWIELDYTAGRLI